MIRLTFGEPPTRRGGQSLRARRSRQWARLDRSFGRGIKVTDLFRPRLRSEVEGTSGAVPCPSDANVGPVGESRTLGSNAEPNR